MNIVAHPSYPMAHNVANADYMALGDQFRRGDENRIMSRSDLMNFASNPHRWLCGYREEEEDTKATRWGSLIDTLRTSPQSFDDLYVTAPATYPANARKKGEPDIEKPWNRNATFCADWEAEQEESGKTVIKADEMQDAKLAVQRLQNEAAIVEYLKGAIHQVQIVAVIKDPITKMEIPVRVLIDVVPPKRSLCDLKTTRNASAYKYSSSVYSFNYDAQAALIMDVFNAVNPDDKRTMFYHIVQENFSPFECALYFLSDEFLECGRIKYQDAIRRYAACLKSGYWPGYVREPDCSMMIEGAGIIEPPTYALSTR